VFDSSVNWLRCRRVHLLSKSVTEHFQM